MRKDRLKLQKALENFEREINQFAGRKLVLDASLSRESLASAVLKFVREHDSSCIAAHLGKMET